MKNLKSVSRKKNCVLEGFKGFVNMTECPHGPTYFPIRSGSVLCREKLLRKESPPLNRRE